MKVNQNLELVLDDPATIEALKETDVVPAIKSEATTAKPYSITLNFTENEVERLARLTATNSWEEAIHENVQSLLVERVGRAVVSSPSQYSQKISGPSNNARFK